MNFTESPVNLWLTGLSVSLCPACAGLRFVGNKIAPTGRAVLCFSERQPDIEEAFARRAAIQPPQKEQAGEKNNAARYGMAAGKQKNIGC